MEPCDVTFAPQFGSLLNPFCSVGTPLSLSLSSCSSPLQEQVDSELDALLARQVQLEARLRSLSTAAPRLRAEQQEARKLSEVIAFTAKLAEGVSAKVKQLDLAKVGEGTEMSGWQLGLGSE